MNLSLQDIDSVIAQGKTSDATALLRSYFLSQPTLATARVVTERLDKQLSVRERASCKVWFLRSFTVEPIFPLLQAAGAVHGLALDLRAGDFNAYAQEILDPESAMYRAKPDVIFLAVQTRDLLPAVWEKMAELQPDQAARLIDEAVQNLGLWIETIRSRSKAKLVILDFAQPAWSSSGTLDAQSPTGQAAQLSRLNHELRLLAAAKPGVFVLPFEALAARIGRERFFDERKWLMARMPLAAGSLWPLAEECLRLLLPITGKVHKALVVDLDNTLWGGVVGEDGANGIKLGNDYPGAAFIALQRALLDLYERGVILAIASKNNELDALEVLKNHPAMLLRPKHFAALRINWNDKAQSLREIAKELNIGVDSLAFLDDNPVERERVRSELPEVYVIDLPSDPMDYASAVRKVPIFERTALSEEDRERGRLYSEQRARSEIRQAAGSIEEFYRSLEMVVTVAAIDAKSVTRVSQLTQKTNQFNLTTRRYDERKIEEIGRDPSWRSFTCSVKDRFGDNGMVGLALARLEGEIWEIDTFLLSCRVIGRTVETALLAYILAEARKAGAAKLRGWYFGTKKNQPAKDFYASHGFVAVMEREGGVLWELEIGSAKIECPQWFKRFAQN